MGGDDFVYTDISELGDVITDFEVGSDQIVLTELFGSQGVPFTNYNFAVNAGVLRFVNLSSGSTRVLFDPDGSSNPDAASLLATVQDVTATSLDNVANFVLS